MQMLQPNSYPGKLIVVEGIDGSGKSTQIDLLYKWLQSRGKSVYFSEWNSSDIVKSTTKLAKKEHMFTPTTFSLLQATDFADRWENRILPMLKAGVIVLADRYAFTAFARDVARGVDPNWVRNLYSFAVMPDIVYYFQVPIDIAVERITSSRASIKYYEAGMDMNLSDNRATSFRLFQQRVIDQYDQMVDEFGLTVVNGTLSVQSQQKLVRLIATRGLKGWEGLPNPNRKPRRPAVRRTPALPELAAIDSQGGDR
jgi:dTMP kinase